MAQETIVFTAGGELPPDIMAMAEQMKPAGFTLRTLPGSTSAAEIAAAMRDAEYLTGFVHFLPDEAYTQATRLKLVQVLSAGYDGGASGACADLLEWWGQLRGGGRAYAHADSRGV